MLTAYVGNWGPAASLPEMTHLRFFDIIFEAVCFTHIKLLVEHAISHEYAFDNKAYKTLGEFRMCGKCSKFEHHRMRTSSHP